MRRGIFHTFAQPARGVRKCVFRCNYPDRMLFPIEQTRAELGVLSGAFKREPLFDAIHGFPYSDRSPTCKRTTCLGDGLSCITPIWCANSAARLRTRRIVRRRQ